MAKILGFLLAILLGSAVATKLEELFPIVNRTATFQFLNKTSQLPSFQREPKTLLNTQTIPRCGEILTASNGGGVFYKTFEQVTNYERCVWIIAAPYARGYTVNILHLGAQTNQPGSKQELIVTGIGWRHVSNGGPTFVSYKPTSTGSLTVQSSNLLLVTFLSENVQGAANGFAIQYQENQSGSHRQTSARSLHQLIDSRRFEFRYPVGYSTYDNFELAALVFRTQNNIYTGNGNLIWYKKGQLEGSSCYDGVIFYKLNNKLPEGNEKWRLSKALCGNESTYELVHDDLTLALFLSDESTTSSGVSFYYSGCPL